MIKAIRRLGSQRATKLSGQVEVFNTEGISGKVHRLPAALPPQVATLHINDTPVLTAALTPQGDEHHTFTFGVYDFWRFAQKEDKITVRVAGTPLRMPSGESFEHPSRSGKESLADLQERLDAGQEFDDEGKIRYPTKDKDSLWQDDVLTLYKSVADIIQSVAGSRAFIYSGTLLGFVRENGFIPHDRDMDCAYLSSRPSAEEARAEFVEIGNALIAAGYQVTPKASCIAVRDRLNARAMVDIAHLFIKPNGYVGFPFGTVGTTEVSPNEFMPVVDATMGGHPVTVPNKPEAVVAHIYGESWQIPNPGFKWTEERQRRDEEALLTHTDRRRLAMDDHYARPSISSGTDFFHWVESRLEVSRNVIDMGCGNGRDTVQFEAVGRQVVAIDASPFAAHSSRLLTADCKAVTVIEADLSEPGLLAQLANSFTDSIDQPVLFYGRFLLNGWTDQEELDFLVELNAAARHGDLVAFEHRTDADRLRKKARFRSFRRFVPVADTLAKLQASGFDIVDVLTGTGLAPFESEDPEVVRILARKR